MVSTQPILGVVRSKNWACTTRFSIVWPAMTWFPGEFPTAISSISDDDETNTTPYRLSAPQALFSTPGLRCLAVVRGRSKPWKPRVSRPTIIVLHAFRRRPSLIFNSPWPQQNPIKVHAVGAPVTSNRRSNNFGISNDPSSSRWKPPSCFESSFDTRLTQFDHLDLVS